MFGLPRTVSAQLPRCRLADGEGGTAAGGHANSAALLPANGGTAAADSLIGTPDDALALQCDALPLLIVGKAFSTNLGTISAC